MIQPKVNLHTNLDLTQSNSRKCMKAVFLLLNRRLLRGSDRKNRLFFRFCCFCSLKRQQKLRVVQVFAVEQVIRAKNRALDMQAESPDAPEALEVLKVVSGDEGDRGNRGICCQRLKSGYKSAMRDAEVPAAENRSLLLF